MSFGVSFVCDKTPLADLGTIAAYERVLCSTLIYKLCGIILPCKFGFGLVCGVCVCLCMMKQRGGGGG